MKWGLPLTIIIVAVLAFGYVHALHKMSQEVAHSRAIRAALIQKIESEFDDYLRAAPLLKGDTKDAFESIVRSRIHSLGFSLTDQRIYDKSYAKAYRKAMAIRQEESAERERYWHFSDAEVRRCAAVLSKTLCREMAEARACVFDGYCTAEVSEILSDNYVSIDELSEVCVDGVR